MSVFIRSLFSVENSVTFISEVLEQLQSRVSVIVRISGKNVLHSFTIFCVGCASQKFV